jgi:FkbM family methyltransferase
MPLLKQVSRFLDTVDRLGNPVHVFYKRAFARPQNIMTIKDRKTGIRCRCTVDSYHIFSGAWYSQVYDVPYVPIRAGDTVLDIGANQGFFTCYAAQLGAKVYAFEPNPESYSRLLENIKINGFGDRVVAKPWAISGSEGTAQLFVSADAGSGTTTLNPAFAKAEHLKSKTTLQVQTYTLSQILTTFGLGDIRICKIDAEGSEIEMLETLSPAQQMSMDAIVAEIHPAAYAPRKFVELIRGWGTHQIGFNEQRPFSEDILRATSNRILLNEDAPFTSNRLNG